MTKTIRVLVVDDSALIRTILVEMLHSEPDLQVVGEAKDGQEAVQMAARLRPDVVTMDIRMPRMNGLEATRQIMRTAPTPIVVVASSVYEADINISFNAIASGALTVVEKPKGLAPSDYAAVRDQLVTTIRLMSDVQVVALHPDRKAAGPLLSTLDQNVPCEVIAMAASTGGPGALRQILGNLPKELSIPIVIVQHITPGFGQGFAHWLNGSAELEVALAKDGDKLVPGRALIAPEGAHLIVTPGKILRLDNSGPIKGQRPSATRLFDSVARIYGPAALGVILSGMGDDGVDGLENLRRASGRVIAQEEESCVVFGMPKVAIERGLVDDILTPEEIAAALVSLNGHPSKSAAKTSVAA